MVKLLGILDIFAAGILVCLAFGIAPPQGLVIALAVYLFFKALLFITDIASLLDVAAGILLILSLWFGLPLVLLIVFAALLGLKGIMSLFA